MRTIIDIDDNLLKEAMKFAGIKRLCIRFNLAVLHQDRDFDNIAKHTSLKIYK